MDELRQDLRIALRAFAKNPGFTAVVVATLALGIGANTAIFGLMDQVLLRLMPVHRPEQLVILEGPGPFSGSSHQNSHLVPFSHPMYTGLRDSGVFQGVLAHNFVGVHLTAGGTTTDARGDLVSGNFFEVLGLEPALGRLFTADDDRVPGAHPVAVLGHGFWTRRFGASHGVIGQTLVVNNQPLTVVGVAPAGFQGVELGEVVDVYVPVMMQAQVIPTWPSVAIGDWRRRWLTLMARLPDGRTLEDVRPAAHVAYARLLQEDLNAISGGSERFRAAFLKKELKMMPGGRGPSGLRDESQTPLLVLMGMVGLVLLIACANVANLLLARASSRQKEIAVRLALGASRGRLARQLLVESLTLALAGGALGMVVATWTGTLLIRALPSAEAAIVLTADPDLRVAGFAFALSVLTGVGFGLVPALQATRPHLAPTLKSESTALAGGTAPFRFRKGLVVAQIALSLLLLIGAGLFTRSLMNLRALDPGFEPDQLLTFTVDPSLNGYDLARRYALYARLQQDVSAEPGVKSVSMADVALMTDSNSSTTIRVEGYEAKEEEDMNPNFNGVAPEFFGTLGIGLLAGRDFTDADGPQAPRVAIVNEEFARYFYKGENPVGRRFGTGRGKSDFQFTIVGLVRDGKAASLREKQVRFAYTPYTQEPNLGALTFYVRTAVDPAVLGPRMRQVVAAADPTLPVREMKTMRAQIRESLFVDRLVAALSAAFGCLATLLAALGLYAVMSHAVSQRTREIGIRVALGAERRAVLALVLKEVAVLAAVGVLIGLPGGYGLGRLVEAQLFGMNARDPLTYAAATLALLAAAFLAGYVPALRATRVDPMVALRYE
ncbi:MAG TPA: ABC transporter permease [Vicinamibacteria bacterium]|jgi:predicted permease